MDSEMMVDAETGEIVQHRKPFGQWLLEQRDGALHSELSEWLQKVAEGVAQTGKKGTVTLTVTIQPMKAPGRMIVTDDVKAKVPEDRGGSIFFERDGNLSRSNPFQPELPLQEVPARDTTTIREVS